MQEQGLRDEDRFEEVVARATVVELNTGGRSYGDVVQRVSRVLAHKLGGEAEELATRFTHGTHAGATPTSHGVAMPYLLLSGVEHPELVIVRAPNGVFVSAEDSDAEAEAHDAGSGAAPVYALFFLTGDQVRAGRMLRILGQLATRVDEANFLDEWLGAATEQELKEVLLADDRTLSLLIGDRGPTRTLAGTALRDIDLPEGCLVALIRRNGTTIVPRGSTSLKAGDRITMIGDPAGISQLSERYVGGDGDDARTQPAVKG